MNIRAMMVRLWKYLALDMFVRKVRQIAAHLCMLRDGDLV
jgi:hypothetical protein